MHMASYFYSKGFSSFSPQLRLIPPQALLFWTWPVWTGSPSPLGLCKGHFVFRAAWRSTLSASRSAGFLPGNPPPATRFHEGPHPTCGWSWRAICRSPPWRRRPGVGGSAGWTWSPWVKSCWCWGLRGDWRWRWWRPARAPDTVRNCPFPGRHRLWCSAPVCFPTVFYCTKKESKRVRYYKTCI